MPPVASACSLWRLVGIGLFLFGSLGGGGGRFPFLLLLPSNITGAAMAAINERVFVTRISDEQIRLNGSADTHFTRHQTGACAKLVEKSMEVKCRTRRERLRGQLLQQ